MKATRELIDAMRVTADRIESGEYQFDWNESATCYCGLLARTVLNLDGHEAMEELNDLYVGYPTWSRRAKKQYCSTTGLKLDKVFQILYNIGLITVEDCVELEFTGVMTPDEFDDLSNPEDLKLIFEEKEYAINYFRTKANELEKQLLNQQVVIKKQVEVQTVTVN